MVSENGNCYQTADGKVHSDIWKYLEEAKENENTVVWIVPTDFEEESSWYASEQLVNFNQRLKQDKKDIQLELCYLYDDNAGGYSKSLLQVLKKGYGDICFSGFRYTESDYQRRKELKQSGVLYDLSDITETEDGQKIYDAFESQEWEAVKDENGTFFLPTQQFLPHRVCVAFSKKYISQQKAQQFDGNLASLSDYIDSETEAALKENTLIWNLDGYDVLNTLGIYEMGGIWYSHETGEAASAFTSEKWYSIYKMLNDCKQKNILFQLTATVSETIPEADNEIKKNNFAIAVFLEDRLLDRVKETSTIYELPYYYAGVNTVNTAVVEQSTKKQKVFSLLSCLLTDSTYANLLILGEKDKDYILKSGYAYTAEGEPMTSYYFKNVFGMNDFVYSSTESDFGKNVAKGKKAYFSSENYRLSALNGFNPDSDSLTDYSDEYEKYADIWQEDDFDSQYEKVQKMFAKKQKEDVEKANQQVKKWKGGAK